MAGKALVLDAILTRAVLGQRVRRIPDSHAGIISFFIPETAYAEAEEHLAAFVIKRGDDPAIALRSLRSMAALGTIVSLDLYVDTRWKREGAWPPAIRRTARFWPPRSHSVVRSGPRYTDFFECGVATWTSASIDSFLTQ